ncbi:hypothetical protein ACS0TY_012119 [Phlomoides rotata]
MALGKNKWIDVWNPNNGCVSCFFKNFSDSCSMKELYRKFKEIGSVRDVFIPKRRDKSGTRFGFVRFGGNVDRMGMEQKLNNIWIGSFKIRANLSKFARTSEKQKLRVEVARPIKPDTRHVIHNSTRRNDHTSYVEAVNGSNRKVGYRRMSTNQETMKEYM